MNIHEINNKLKSLIDETGKLCFMKSFPSLTDEIQSIREELDSNEFRITVVGEFSSGKSTFLNAMIGKDILPHGVKETTATVTYIHNVAISDPRINKAIVHFTDESHEDISLDIGKDRNALVDYVTTSDNKYNVVKDIQSVELYVHFTGTEEPIVLIDTPGMNGVAEGHREITLHEIRHSHASICLFHLRGIGKTDLEFIKELMKHQDTFFFVINAIDDINANEETYEERLAAFSNDIYQHVFSAKKMPENIFGVSALQALVSRDHEIPRLYQTDKTDLTEEQRQQMFKESKMDIFESTLFAFLNNSEKERIFYESICNRLLLIINSSRENADRNKRIRETNINNIPEKKKIEELIRKADESAQKFRSNIEAALKARIEDLRILLYQIIREDLQKKDEELQKIISNWNIDEAKKAQDNNIIGKRLNEFWSDQTMSLTEKMKKGLNDVQVSIISDMKRAIPSISFKDKKLKIETKETFEASENSMAITRLQKLREKKMEAEKELKKIKVDESSSSIEKKLIDIEQEESQLRQRYRSMLRDLGTRPPVHYREIERTVSVKRKLFGISIPFTRHDETIIETVADDYAQKNYDKERRRIENQYNASIKLKTDEKEYLEAKLEKVSLDEYRLKDYKSKIQKLEVDIANEQREMEQMMKNNKSSILKKIKKDYIEAVEKQVGLNGQMYADLTAGVRENLQEIKDSMLQALYKLFDEKKEQYINELKLLIKKVEDSANVSENEAQIQILSSDIRNIDNLINKLTRIKNEL